MSKPAHLYDIQGKRITSIHVDHDPQALVADSEVPSKGKLVTFDLTGGGRAWLVLDPYGNEIVPEEIEDRLFWVGIRKTGYTVAIERATGQLFVCTFTSERKGIKTFLTPIDRTVPKKFRRKLDELRSQKRPFHIGFPDWALLRFIDREASYNDLRSEYHIALAFHKSTLEVAPNQHRETRRWEITASEKSC